MVEKQIAVRFGADGLVPAIVQDTQGRVLMLAYMNAEALRRTRETGRTWFWSRSRQELWPKGDTSGHVQKVRDIRLDCDGDALLVTVDQIGVACHEGDYSCFHYDLEGARPDAGAGQGGPDAAAAEDWSGVLRDLERVIWERRANPPEGSYTAKLFAKAPDAICKKVGEEATEVVLASKNNDRDNLIHEAADLLYHTMVLLAHHGVTLGDVAAKLGERRK